MQRISETVSDIVVEKVAPERESNTPQAHSILDAFNDLSEINITDDDTYQNEIQKYLDYKVTAKDLDFLAWWRDHKLHFSRLYNRSF